MSMSAVLRFANAAKRSGAAEVYAVAARELDAEELGHLLLHLRRVEPDWRLPSKERRRLAAELIETGAPDRDVLAQTEISRTTLWRIRRELVDKPKRAPDPALQSAGSVSTQAPATHRSCGPILHAEATSGNGDFGAMARLLRGSR